MNNTVLKIIAGILALGAVVVAFLGIKLSQQPAKAPAVQVAPATAAPETVVVAARLIKAGKPLGSADVILKSVQGAPRDAFHQTPDMLGKMPLVDIQPGTPLQPSLFMADTLTAQLRPGERAIAIQVDEVGALAGLVRPGDHVDVVSFGGNDTDSGMLAYAQVSVPNARVLSIGPITQMSVDKAKNEAARTTPDAPAASDAPAPINTLPAVSPNLGPKDPAEMTAFLRELRSAVLAIPEADVPRLMLAAYSGQLRLALRPYSLTQTEPDAVSGRLKPAESIANQRLTILRPELAPNASVGRRLKATSGGQVVIQEGSNERKLPPEEQ